MHSDPRWTATEGGFSVALAGVIPYQVTGSAGITSWTLASISGRRLTCCTPKSLPPRRLPWPGTPRRITNGCRRTSWSRYTDGLAQVTIKGGPEHYAPDHQEPCDPWLFVLLDEAENYYVPESPELGRNGSFGVFKMIQQDVVGFEQFLQDNKHRIDPELLAAKICGRWRNEVPLVLSPDTDTPLERIPLEQLHNFEYVHKDGSGDPQGLRCPIGAHIRRVNPRGQPVAGQGRPGGSNNTHRLIRRSLPYGPTYVPGQQDDGIERGLLGYFINAHIENQHECVLKQWVNDAAFVGAVRLNPKAKDVIIGTNDPADSVFDIPQPGGAPPLQVRGFSSFITTRAVAYCFLPSVTALKFIASLTSGG